ncbi:MAG: crossover junction endodeoxyribonuclease RuvC [Ignavibacteria bacterium]|nr:crossover junction endodeoxyribonuclease RuvC [Ignavibacteria bacterium]
MIILGVDPGTLTTGYGIIEAERSEISLIASGVIKSAKKSKLPLRLELIYNELAKIIQKYLPDEFAIESAFYGKNAQSALKIGHARGVSILAAIHFQIPTAEYSPREIKKSVVGNGAASKQQVMYMVNHLLKLKQKKTKLDETDAIAVALCHFQKLSSPVKRHKDWKAFIEANPQLILKK